MDQTVPLPSSLVEVESLIFSLYDPRTAHTNIVTVQETLQHLQRSPAGWQLAQTLLDRPVRSVSDDQIKFFGALTIIIKLNTESSTLSEDDASELLRNLLRWLASSAGDSAGVLSTQKLCQALVTFFIHFSALWPNCVKSLLLSLRTGHAVSHEDVESAPAVADILAGLDWRILRVALWFVNNLVTDVGKTDMKFAAYAVVHERLLKNAADAATLLHVGLVSSVSDPSNLVTIRRESIKSLQSWILYAQRLPLGGDGLVGPLRALVDPVLACLRDDELYDAAIELLIDILSNYSKFFSAEHYGAIASVFESSWGDEHLQQLVGGDFDFEPLQYGLFLLAFGDARVENLMQSSDSQSRKILRDLLLLLAAKGYPVAEDLVFVPALEFWAAFAETMLDTMFSNENHYESWVDSALGLIKEVVGHCWEKIQYPTVETFMSWDSSDREGFGDARRDVADLMQTVFTVAGRDLLAIFADLLLRSIPEKTWAQIEAAAFCLASLSDCVSDDTSYDSLLADIFSESFFSLLALGEAQLPVRLRQTALSLIERYSEYFERTPAHLPAALNLLFEAVSTPSLAGQASKAISTLCSSCRVLLTSEVQAFLQQYQLLHDNPQLDPLAEERVVSAIAAIIQATSNETVRLQLAEQLLPFMMRDVELALQLNADASSLDTSAPPPLIAKAIRACQQQLTPEQPAPSVRDVMLQAALIPLRCMAGMARGLRSATDNHIDLESINGNVATKAASAVNADENQQLRSLQSNIMAMILAIQDAFPRSSEAIALISVIFKAGFSETEPGLFVFPPEVVTEMLVRQTVQTPYIGVVVKMAHSFVSSLGKTLSNETAAKCLTTLVPWVLGLLQSLPTPDADTELTQNGIEFVDRVIQKNTVCVLRVEPAAQLEFFFLFTLKVLDGREPLPKAAAAEFWTTFLVLRPEHPSLKAFMDSAMAHLGPLLAQSLVQNFGGNASRSELDKLCEPLKKLVVQHVRSQAWLEHALMSPLFPSDRVSTGDRTVFLKKIMSLRGARQTNNVVREFWLACRGSNFAYAS